jgi:hypothetical protein
MKKDRLEIYTHVLSSYIGVQKFILYAALISTLIIGVILITDLNNKWAPLLVFLFSVYWYIEK